jgi:predicted ATP-binding protein involved in virulence
MNIKSITIQNFRGFEDRTFEFDSKMNVVLGDNTTGKTTLLHAVQIALGAYLQAMSLIPGGKAYSRNFKQTDYVMNYIKTNDSFVLDINKPYIKTVAEFHKATYNVNTRHTDDCDVGISWYRNSNTISRISAGELMNAVSEMEAIRRNADSTGTISVFPLMLSFGAKRLDKNYRSAQKTKARESREAKAYKSALNEEVDFKAAFDWMYRYDRNLDKGKEFEGTKEAFFEVMKKAIPAIKHIEIDVKNEELNAEIQMTKDPNPYPLTYDMMSDGFKAMINIVAEIAYRCIELNGFLGRNAVKQTPGVVLIDELDLYLHPHWQQHVLADLQDAFPKFQFIVTTHSPFIVQSVKKGNVISLDGVRVDTDPQMRNIEDIIYTEMQTEPRHSKYKNMLNMAEEYYQLVKGGKGNTSEAEQVKKRLDEIEMTFSDDPAYVALLKAERKSI